MSEMCVRELPCAFRNAAASLELAAFSELFEFHFAALRLTPGVSASSSGDPPQAPVTGAVPHIAALSRLAHALPVCVSTAFDTVEDKLKRFAMGLKKVIKWALVCGQRKMQSRKSPMHFVCSKSYADGNRETRRLLVLLEDLRQLYAAAWGKVMASLESCFDVIQGREPGLVKSMCSVVLLWVQLGDTVAKDFDPDLWRQPALQSINDLNDALLRMWKVAMDKTAELVYKIIPETTPDVAMVIEKEYHACRQETWTLFQVTPETLEHYLDTLKVYTSNMSLWHLDERKFLNTDATLVKSLSQLNIAAS